MKGKKYGRNFYCVISGTRGVVADQYLDLSQAEHSSYSGQRNGV